MRRSIPILCSGMLLAAHHQSWPEEVTTFDVTIGSRIELESQLDDGRILENLRWATSSSNACFVKTSAFEGPHVFFATTIPEHSKMEIVASPRDDTENLSLYAYEIATTDYSLPPDLPRSVSCESDQKWDIPKVGATQDHTRKVRLTATTNAYHVVIGVSRPLESDARDFTLEVSTAPYPE